MKKFLALTFVLVAALTTLASAADDIIINDFEAKNYGDWKVEGEAFGKAPVTGAIGGQRPVTGFAGKQLVNTFLRGDKTTGQLTSPEFTIERKFINLLIGGGAHKGTTCVNLLVDGKKVASATGGNNEFLNWKTFDVAKYKGKKAVLVIVDDHTTGWGHINVDQIVQSDTKAKANPVPASAKRPAARAKLPPQTKELKVTGKYLLFPVTNGDSKTRAPSHRLTIVVGDQLVHNIGTNLASTKDAIDWWSYLDMAEFQGKTATIASTVPEEVFGMIKFGDTVPDLMPRYDEKLRPQFHISQMRGWNNDPNGMMYHDGEWHFFWQCNPGGRNWGNMYWGHAVSPDLVHWTELDRALRNGGGQTENKHRALAVGACFSGSGNVDKKNTGGWKTGKEDVLIVAYTDTGCGEAIAYSNDRGRTWTQYKGNPVIAHKGRDPKLLWYEPGKHWVIAVFHIPDATDRKNRAKNGIAIYTSKDLKEWTKTDFHPGYHECPELFELPVDGDASKKKWVLFGGDGKYVVGDFDGKKFTPDGKEKHRLHHGSFYASQCFSNSPEGRVIQVGWARIPMPEMPFNQTFSLPINLTLHTTPEGIRMFANPVEEIASLREGDPATFSDQKVGEDSPLMLDAKGQLYDILVTVKNKDAKSFALAFGENLVTYNFDSSQLNGMPLVSKKGEVSFRVLVDRPMFEVVAGQGESYLTSARKDGGEPLKNIRITAEGGTVIVKSLQVYKMKSAWKKK